MTPRLTGIPYFETPPLQYWATAAIFAIAGEDEWTARLAPALAGFIAVLAVWATARRLYPRRAGWMAARRHRAQGTSLSKPRLPNNLWCADYKGESMLADRRYCYPLTIGDFATRYLFSCEALATTQETYAFVRRPSPSMTCGNICKKRERECT